MSSLVQLAQTADGQTVPSPLGHTWFAYNGGEPWSCGRTSSYARFEVRPGEAPSFDVPEKERSELVCYSGGSTFTLPYDTDVWLSLAMRLPSGSYVPPPGSPVWMIAGQFHSTYNTGDNKGLSPPWAQQLWPGDWVAIYTRSAPVSPVVTNPAPVETRMFQLTRDTWAHLVYRLQFNQTGGGLMDVYKDGAQIYSGTPAIGYNQPVGPYLQYGVYRAAALGTTVLEYANVEVGTSSLSSRIANPLPIP